MSIRGSVTVTVVEITTHKYIIMIVYDFNKKKINKKTTMISNYTTKTQLEALDPDYNTRLL